MSERELAERLISFALEPTVAIGIAATTPTEDPDSYRSASGLLIILEGVPYLITDWHVLEKYRTLASFRETQFFFADTAIDPIERLHAESKELDLAVLLAYNLRIRTDRNRLSGVPHVRPYEPRVWPPSPPQPGESVFFAGWPEVGRKVDVANMEATFSPYAYVGASVSEVGSGNFTIQFDRSRFRGVSGFETQKQLQERDLEGLSGSPIFRYMPALSPEPELVGFVREYSKTWDLLIATSALCLLPDGRIATR
jgi:hypothetical protein